MPLFDPSVTPDGVIAYDGAGGLFTEVGKMIGSVNRLRQIAEDDIPTLDLNIATPIEPERLYIFDGLTAAKNAGNEAMLDYMRAIVEAVKVRMQDFGAILLDMSLWTTDIQQVLQTFRAKMVTDGKTVKKNTVTVGAVTAGSLNVGNASILTSKVLDGFNEPTPTYFPADQRYSGIDSELCAIWENMVIECTNDSQSNGTDRQVFEGSETLRISGNPFAPVDANPTPYFGPGVEGSGNMLIRNGGYKNLALNGSMDTWSDATPPVISGWTLGAGVVNDTHVKKETTNIYRSSGASLKIVGDGALATIELDNQAPFTSFKPLRRYAVTIRYKADAAVASGTLGVEFNGTGYAPGTDKISIATGAIATVWTLASFQLITPAVIPVDWRLVLKVTGTLTNARIIYIDDVIVQPMDYFGGIAVAVVPGSIPVMKRDKWTFQVTNDRAGIIQSFWGRTFGRQLPSSASPNISDALTTIS